MNPDCAINNGQIRIWRTNRGHKGGGKGWCNSCLKIEENQNLKVQRNENGNYFFDC